MHECKPFMEVSGMSAEQWRAFKHWLQSGYDLFVLCLVCRFIGLATSPNLSA
jgi:hypothetical protein